MFPFKEKLLKENYYLREFKNTVTRDELVWHRDKEDRLVTLVEGDGWKLQLDNKLPFELEKGKVYFIAKETWHRIIKGDTNLKIIVEKKEELDNLLDNAFGKALSAFGKLMKSEAEDVADEIDEKSQQQKLDEGVLFGLGVALAAPALVKIFAQIAKLFANTIQGWTGKNVDSMNSLADKIIKYSEKVHHKFIVPIEFFVKKVLRIKDESKAKQASELLFNLLVAFLMVYSGVGAVEAAEAGKGTLAGFEGLLAAVKGGEVNAYLRSTLKRVATGTE